MIADFRGLLVALASGQELCSLIYEDDCDLSAVLSRLDVKLSRALLRRINAEGISALSSDIYIG